MRPAPKNPTPDGIAAVTRDESQDMGESRNASWLLIVKKHEPNDTKAIVRIPAGLSDAIRKRWR